MPPLERRSDRWVSTALSVVLHGALIGVLVYGWLSFRKESRPPPTLAINATVVSSKAVNGSSAVTQPTPARAPPQKVPPAPTPPPPPPPQPAVDESTVPPPPDMTARQEAARKAAQAADQQAAQAQADAERKMREAAQRKEQEEEQKVAEEKAKKLAEAKAAAEAKKRALAAEQQRLADAKRKAEEKRRADEAKALAANQADLQQSVEADEKALAARSGPAMASWVQLIRARIEHAWIRPPTAKEGIDCTVDVTQVPGGQVVNVKVGTCNGDAAVIQSIQDAAYRASPLPAPPDPTLFERDLQLDFKPTD
ncbi:MAG: cell envelope integrity protein TolA [Steroidobacteraceae bacterium]